MDKQHLFEARTNGYKTYRIPGIVTSSDGAVIVTAEARPGEGGDYDYNDVVMRRSTDGGDTFEPARKLVDHRDYGEGPVSNFVMIPDRDTGHVVAVFCHDYARVFAMRSRDDGATWTEPQEITDVFEQFRDDYPWRVCATGPGHGTQLRNGRMIVPVWLSDGSGGEFGEDKRGHRPSIVSLIYSEDGGETWERGEIVCRHGDTVEGVEVVNPSETVAVELNDGGVMFNIRSESMNNRRLIGTSPNGVTGWTCQGFDDELVEPVCMASLLRYDWPEDDGPGRILFANPDTLGINMRPWVDPAEEPHRDRKNLTIRLSEDDGKNWIASRVIEPGPSGYSDLTVLPDGRVGCLYEDQIVERIHDDKYVTLIRFELEWILSGSVN
ncbi:MAG: sialidase family protein [Candidatus Brocadiia bacterium]